MCLGCEEAFLRPGTRADEWRSAVRCGTVGDTTARDFERLTKDRKCTRAAGVGTNGVSLGYCHACYKTLQPPPPSKGAVTCLSLLHPYVPTDRPATVTPGPKCLDPLWGQAKARDQRRLHWRQRQKVCPTCKWRAEAQSASNAPTAARPSPVPVVAEGGSPPAQLRQVHKQSTSPPAVLTASSIAGIDVDPALTGAAAIMTSHLQQTKPDEISVKFSNGRLRTYKRVSQATSAAVGERQARRRRKSVASLVSSLATVDPQEIGAVVTGILRRARAQGGVSVAPLKALSVQQQLQFKIANKVSGVTWGRFRAFTGDSRLASNQALRAEAARFSTEERNQVATTEDGAFLISPRAAVQAHLDDLVSRGGFVECPVQPDPVMGGRGVGCQRSARGPSSGDARGTAEHDCSVGSRGAGGGESALSGGPAVGMRPTMQRTVRGPAGCHWTAGSVAVRPLQATWRRAPLSSSFLEWTRGVGRAVLRFSLALQIRAGLLASGTLWFSACSRVEQTIMPPCSAYVLCGWQMSRTCGPMGSPWLENYALCG